MAMWGDKGQGAEGLFKLCLWYRQGGERWGLAPAPVPAALGPASSSTSPSAQRQHHGVTAWALSQEPGSTTRETMELFWLGTAFQGQLFSGEKKYFIFKKKSLKNINLH